jgi:succinoglycan biosynthesis transport protein ExoP
VTPLNQADPNANYQLGPVDEAPPSDSPINARRLLAFLLKYWWLPILTLVLGVGAAILYLRHVSPTFVSSASLWEVEKLRMPNSGEFSGDSQNYLGTQIELLRSPELAQLAIQRLLNSGTNPIPKDAEGRRIPAQVLVAQVPKSEILEVEAATTDAVYSQVYLNALLNEYLDFKKNIRKSESESTYESLSERVSSLERNLHEEQDKLMAYERTNNFAILQSEVNSDGTYLAKLTTEVADLQLELNLLEENQARQQTNDNAGVESVTVTPDGVSGSRESASGVVGNDRRSAAREIEMLELKRSRLSQVLQDKHPKMIKLTEEINNLKKLDELYRTQDKKQLEATRQALLSRIAGLKQLVKQWEVKVAAASEGFAQADQLKLNVGRIQAEYDQYMALLRNIDIGKSFDQETLGILQPPSPAWRSFRKEQKIEVGGVVAGLLAGLAIIFLIAWRDDRFTSLLEVSEKFGDVIVGQVPQLPRPRGEKTTPLLQIEDDRQMYAESYRNLRSALLFMPTLPERAKVMLVTSAMPHEGKSTIASNLARTLALGGSRVVLIDADLRRGHLHELLGMKREPGLTDLLQHPEDLDKIIQSNCTPNLSFISRGWTVSRPGDLFVGPELELLLTRLRQQFDFVVIDTSPVFASDDVTTLAPRADGTLFVVRNGVSRSSAVTEALEILSRRQVKLLGIVVNGAHANSKSYHYYKNEEYYQPLVDSVKKLSGGAGRAEQPGSK